jgi:hydrogenase 3 maturation protease
MNLNKILKIRLENARRTAILGIGSDLRADDAAGVAVARQIEAKTKKSKTAKVFIGETAPENLTGEIKKYNPDHLIIVDSSDTGAKPGTINIIDMNELAGISFSTHQMPVKILADYIQNYIKCSVLVIGIQPKTVEYGKPVTKAVQTSIKQVASALLESI